MTDNDLGKCQTVRCKKAFNNINENKTKFESLSDSPWYIILMVVMTQNHYHQHEDVPAILGGVDNQSSQTEDSNEEGWLNELLLVRPTICFVLEDAFCHAISGIRDFH